jgi:hypothetical protein
MITETMEYRYVSYVSDKEGKGSFVAEAITNGQK